MVCSPLTKSVGKKIKRARECMDALHTTKQALANQLGISRSALYYRLKQPAKDEAIKHAIAAVMYAHKAYGQRRVADALRINKKKAQRIMRQFGLRPKIRRATRPSKPDDIGRKELLRENVAIRLCPIQPHIVWAGDFTYFWYDGRFWYLATVIDVYTREIAGWHIANHHTTALITEAFKDAVTRTGETPTWFHSDQGSEYVSGGYEALLTSYGVIPSHSRKASPWQNGFQESFYSNFKLELGNITQFNSIGEFIEAIHQQLNYYNQSRIHTALKMPPIVYRKSQQQKGTARAVALQLVC